MKTGRQSFRCLDMTGHSRATFSPAVVVALLIILSLVSPALSSNVYLTSSLSPQYTPWLGYDCDASCADPLLPCSFTPAQSSSTFINVTDCFIELVDFFDGYNLQFGDVDSGVSVSNLTLRAPHGFNGNLSFSYLDAIFIEDFIGPNTSINIETVWYTVKGNVSITNAIIRDVLAHGSHIHIYDTHFTRMTSKTNPYDANIASVSQQDPLVVLLMNVSSDAESPSYPSSFLWVGELHTLYWSNVTVGHRSLLVSAPQGSSSLEIWNSQLNFSRLLECSQYSDTVNLTITSSSLIFKNDNSSESRAMISRDDTDLDWFSFLFLQLYSVDISSSNENITTNPLLLFSSASSAEMNCTLEIKRSTFRDVDFGTLRITNASVSDSIFKGPNNPTFIISEPIRELCLANVSTGEHPSEVLAASQSALNAATFGLVPAVNVFFNTNATDLLSFTTCTRKVELASLILSSDVTLVGQIRIFGNISSVPTQFKRQIVTSSTLGLSSGSSLTLSSSSAINSVLVDSTLGKVYFTPALGSSGSLPLGAFANIKFADSSLSNFQIDWPSLDPSLFPIGNRDYVLSPSYPTFIDTGFRKYNGWSVRIYTDTRSRALLYRYYRQTCSQSCAAPFDTNQCLNTDYCSCPNGWAGTNCSCYVASLPVGATCVSNSSDLVIAGPLNIDNTSSLSIPSQTTVTVTGDLIVDGTLIVGTGSSLITTGVLSANGLVYISAKLQEFRFSGRCVIYSNTNVQALALQFSNATKLSLELDASDLTTDGSCIPPTPANALDGYFNTTLSSLSTTVTASQAIWSISILLHGNPLITQDASRMNFQLQLLTSKNISSSKGSPSITIKTNVNKGSACPKTTKAPGLVYLIVSPCTATSSIPWWALTIPLIIIFSLVIILLIAIFIFKCGQEKILPWHQVIYNPFNPHRRVTLVDLD